MGNHPVNRVPVRQFQARNDLKFRFALWPRILLRVLVRGPDSLQPLL